MKKSAFVAILGRPSAGKSTLVNALCGHKVSIVSPVPQTTRNAIRGIYSEGRGQLVFVDTPGFHKSEKTFNIRLSGLVSSNAHDADVILYVLDLTRAPGEEEDLLAALVADLSQPLIVVLNKTDAAGSVSVAAENAVATSVSGGNVEAGGQESDQDPRALARAFVAASLPKAVSVLEISAKNGTGIPALKDALFEASPEGSAWYPEEFYTDQETDFRIAEIVREQVILRTREEIPHAVYVEVDSLELKTHDGNPITADSGFDFSTAWDLPLSKKPRLSVRASVCVETESQKGIVVGKAGSLIGEIRVASEKEMKEIFPYYINLELRVKTSGAWRNDKKILGRIVH